MSNLKHYINDGESINLLEKFVLSMLNDKKYNHFNILCDLTNYIYKEDIKIDFDKVPYDTSSYQKPHTEVQNRIIKMGKLTKVLLDTCESAGIKYPPARNITK